MGAALTFFAVSFDEVAAVVSALPDGSDALTTGRLADHVALYLAGDRSWTTVGYTLEKVCSVLGPSHQLQSFDRSYDASVFLARADALLRGIGIADFFAPRFAAPFVDRPIDLPRHVDWPNVAFFRRASMQALLAELDAKTPAIPRAFAALRDEIVAGACAIELAQFDRVTTYTQLVPAVGWDWIVMDVDLDDASMGGYPRAELSRDFDRAEAFMTSEERRTADPSCDAAGIDVQACRMLLEWKTFSAACVSAGRDVALFVH